MSLRDGDVVRRESEEDAFGLKCKCVKYGGICAPIGQDLSLD